MKQVVKNNIIILTIVVLLVLIAFYAFPISANQISKDTYNVLRNSKYEFDDYIIIDTKVLPASIIYLIQNVKDTQIMYLQAEKCPFLQRYRLILNPQPIKEQEVVWVDDFFYRIEFSRNDKLLSVKCTYFPSMPIYTLLLWGLMFFVVKSRYAFICFKKHKQLLHKE